MGHIALCSTKRKDNTKLNYRQKVREASEKLSLFQQGLTYWQNTSRQDP